MNEKDLQNSTDIRVMERTQFSAVVDAALIGGVPRFARQAALIWLAVFPGDLGMNFKLAKALIADGKTAQGFLILEKIVMIDPEYVEVWDQLIPMLDPADITRWENSYAAVCLFGGNTKPTRSFPGWIRDLQKASDIATRGNLLDAENIIIQIINNHPDCIAAAVLHLKLIHKRKDILALYRYAEKYHTKWPDCLPINLFLADARIEMGFEPEAVELLHRCVANDSCGQVASRMWGEQHVYRPMWPEKLEVQFDQPIPVEVAVKLGWNMLPQGEKRPISQPTFDQPDLQSDEDFPQPANNQITPTSTVESQQEVDQSSSTHREEEKPDKESSLKEARAANGDKKTASSSALPKEISRKIKGYDPLKSISDEFEKIAKRLKKPALSRSDGRYPVFIVFSSKIGLEKLYGPQTSSIILDELKALVAALRNRPGMGSMLFVPDDEELMKLIGLSRVESLDPWKLKLSLADLDQALAKKGEMIGALMIIGGPEVVPFHLLPNPIDDMDKEVPSDNPYATTDVNYFVPEWPVGRVPGENGPDAGFLLEQIRKMTKGYGKKSKLKSISLGAVGSIIDMLWEFISIFKKNGKDNSLGYSAQVWQNSSKAVYKSIGDPNHLDCSPPETNESIDKSRVLQSQLSYYNLHGLVDAGEWYGQRDPSKVSSGPDYPVALSPKDIKRNGHSPQVVYTEACYGANIQNKSTEDALALKFLSLGTNTFVGSTCIAYGSVDVPLIAADLLGNAFWNHLKNGEAVGYAFMQAKLDLVKEMNKRQGYLDAEDQKTLISFILLGDPMTVYKEPKNGMKTLDRSKDHPLPKMICDQEISMGTPQPVSGEILDQIKGVVETYLPGLKDGEISFAMQKMSADSLGMKNPDMDKNQTRSTGFSSQRIVVSMRKAVSGPRHIHYHLARVTLDSRGKMVKLTVSR